MVNWSFKKSFGKSKKSFWYFKISNIWLFQVAKLILAILRTQWYFTAFDVKEALLKASSFYKKSKKRPFIYT